MGPEKPKACRRVVADGHGFTKEKAQVVYGQHEGDRANRCASGAA